MNSLVAASQDAVDADEDAASAVLEDYMSRLATLARAAPQLSFPHLTQQIEERRLLLLSASAGRGTGGADLDVVGGEQGTWGSATQAFILVNFVVTGHNNPALIQIRFWTSVSHACLINVCSNAAAGAATPSAAVAKIARATTAGEGVTRSVNRKSTRPPRCYIYAWKNDTRGIIVSSCGCRSSCHFLFVSTSPS